MRMRGVGAKRGTAYVPSEVMELVADVGCVDASDLPAEALGFRIDVERYQPVRRLPCRVERDHVGERLDWRFRRETRRRIKGLIGSEKCGCHSVPAIPPSDIVVRLVRNEPMQLDDPMVCRAAQ